MSRKLCSLLHNHALLKPICVTDNDCKCLCPHLFLPFTAIFQRSHRCQKFSHAIRSCFHIFILGRSESQPPPAIPFCPPHRWYSRFLTVPHHCPKRQLRWTQTSLPAAIQTKRRRFEGRRQISSPTNRQDLSAFYRTLRDLERKADTNDAVRNKPLLTTFTEVLANSAVWWEVRKTKPTVVEDAVSLELEKQSFLNIHCQQPDDSLPSLNRLTGLSPSQSGLLSDLIFIIEEQLKRVAVERNVPQQQNRSDERLTNNHSQPSDSTNHTNESQCRNSTWS